MQSCPKRMPHRFGRLATNELDKSALTTIASNEAQETLALLVQSDVDASPKNSSRPGFLRLLNASTTCRLQAV
jgi:type III secretory pathway lipoprotein EscJ